MSLLKSLLKFWTLPETRHLNVDDVSTVLVHRRVLETNPILNAIYRRWYSSLLPAVEETRSLSALPIIELGCGPSFLERFVPGIIKTDIALHPNAGQIVDAHSMPFADQSVRAFLMVGTFHHFRDPRKFLKEAIRCLAPGGRLVMVEPSDSFLHRWMVKFFHPTEYFDGSVTGWENYVGDRMSKANNAIPSVVFRRDLKIFQRDFPELGLRSLRYHSPLLFYFSGGYSYRPALPAFLVPIGMVVEKITERLWPGLGSMMTIDLEKTPRRH